MGEKEVLRANVSWKGAMEYVGEDSKGHQIVMEANERFGGTGKRPIPLEVLLMSLGGCIGVDARHYLLQSGLTFDSLKVSIEGTRKDEFPRTFEKVDVRLAIKGRLDPAQVKEIVHQVMTKYCPIAVIFGSTTRMSWEIDIEG